MAEYGIITKQGDFGDEGLRPELIADNEYDPLLGTGLSTRLTDHDNSAFNVWKKNKEGKNLKKIKATCYICDEMSKKKVPSINAANIVKRSQDLEKIEECIYILDNSWRRREQQQIEAIEYRGDAVLFDMKTHEIITASGVMTDIERSHLDAAYIYRDRMRNCIPVRDQLKANIDEYKHKQSQKKPKSTHKKTRSGQKGGKCKKKSRRKLNK